ncbi:MAG: Gfo/Idh/MocA family oxidoreductase [Gemmatimonadetes bacterium]|nr:Gfo/Idh/MocA family oxidoreductase [Gemmatimonadota bacterium]
MEAIRLGVVGSGGMARSRAAAFAAMEGCQLTALAARNERTGAELAQRHEVELLGHWQALIDQADIDAVAICTNNDSHAPIATAALEAGKHVFLEYPLARCLDEGESLVDLARATGKVLRVAHPEVVSAEHRQLKEAVASLGGLLVALFTRLTPGRGARPEVLFNLRVSGPPSLFFVYHVYPLVDLFGPAAWVEGYAHYDGLNADGAYERFVNRVVVGFAGGGTAQWTWAGGIAISRAEQYEHLVLEGGTLAYEADSWCRSTVAGAESLPPPGDDEHSLESLFLKEVRGGDGWRADLAVALEAIRIGLGAAAAAAEGRRVALS